MDQVTPNSSTSSRSSEGDSSLWATAATSIADLHPNTSKGEKGDIPLQASSVYIELHDMFSENSAAKIWRVAEEYLGPNNQPDSFPEWVPSEGENAGKYVTREPKFWTCGFFPGSLYTILERAVKYPKSIPLSAQIDRAAFHDQLFHICRNWSSTIHGMATRTDTHDMGFIVLPALRADWELTGNRQSLESVITAANSLSTRWNERVGAIRSWNQQHSKNYSITNMDENFLVIIDSMCNMDLLYYVGHHTRNQKLIDIATSHALAVLRGIFREDGSTFHVCNFDPKTGAIKAQQTHQGLHDQSTWSRGQAWGILGFAQTYNWTKDKTFLNAAITLANHFLAHLDAATHHHPYVPLWDFKDEETKQTADPLRDTSAAMIAANGLLLLHQALSAPPSSSSPYFAAAVRITKETIDLSYSHESSHFTANPTTLKIEAVNTVPSQRWDSILKNATANHNPAALHRYSNHGLVYADYYFLELGNKLLRMGYV